LKLSWLGRPDSWSPQTNRTDQLQSKRSWALKPCISRMIAAPKDGDIVDKIDLLFEINPSPWQIKLNH
jgi:hypothetical protein